MKFIRRLIVGIILLGIIAAVPGYFYLKQSISAVNPEDKTIKLFYVNAGSSLSLILRKLESDNFIKDYKAARIYTILKGNKKNIQPGFYQLSKSMSFEEIFNLMASGKTYHVWITIPEGFSIRKIARRIEKKDLSERKYLDLAIRIDPSEKEEYPFLEKLDSSNSLEGYLFPDTYDITGGKENDLIQLQLKQFENTIYEAWQNRPSGWKMTLHQTLTLASIVELEAQKPEERSLIAGVFINRLKQGIPLGSDPTVEYALGWHQNEKGLSLNDIQVRSAYNTYKNPGLPPGPICNPGLAAFKATLKYDNTPYLYFVARGDGSHVFTKTYPEHLHAQAMILRGRR